MEAWLIVGGMMILAFLLGWAADRYRSRKRPEVGVDLFYVVAVNTPAFLSLEMVAAFVWLFLLKA